MATVAESVMWTVWVIVVALPVLRPLRLLRMLSLRTVLQPAATVWGRSRITVYVAGSALMLVSIAALAELETLRDRTSTTASRRAVARPSRGGSTYRAMVTTTARRPLGGLSHLDQR